MSNKTCMNCIFADIEGGDYVDGFGGCYTPEIVSDCKCSELADRDLEEILELGEQGKCSYFVESKEGTL